MRFWIPILLLATVAACAPGRHSSARYQFSVSGDRSAAATTPADGQAMRQFLNAKARQICTLGYRIVKVDTVAAEDGRQIVDMNLRCNPYRPEFTPELSSLGRIF